MPRRKIMTKARVRVLLEVCLPDTWEDDCPLNQVYKQSEASVRNIITQRIVGSMKDIKIVGTPEIEAIFAVKGE